MSEAAFSELAQKATSLDYNHRVLLLTLLAQSLHNEEKTAASTKKRQFGREKGKFSYPVNFDDDNEEIAKLFGVL